MDTRPEEEDILEKFGPYEIVARFFKGEHRGILWRSGKKLIEVTAASNEEARNLLESRFYEQCMEKARERGVVEPSEKEMVQALMYIWPHLNSNQIKMLQAQYRAPNRSMSTLELAAVAGYKTHHPVNLFYGQAGFMLFSELPGPLPTDDRTGAPIYSFALSKGGGKQEDQSRKAWIWEMRPSVARGLELAGLIKT